MARERTSPPRQRVVALQIKLPCATREELKKDHGRELSKANFFIRTRTPKAVHTLVRFDLRLAQGESVLRGLGVVTEVRDEDPGPPGMLLQVRGLDAASHLFLQALHLKVPVPTIRAGVTGDPESRRYLQENPAPEAPADEVVQALPKPGRAAVSHAGGLTAVTSVVPSAELPKAVPPPAHLTSGVTRAATSTSGVNPATTSGVTKDSTTTSGVTKAARTSGITKTRPSLPPRSGPIVGIDFGTTQTSVAWVSDDRPELILSPEGDTRLQSLFGVDARGLPLVGAEARKAVLQTPQNAVREGRRLVGRATISDQVQDLQRQVSFTIVEGHEGLAAANLAGHAFLMEDVASRLIGEAAGWAEKRLGKPVGRAVVTVPAMATPAQRQAVRDATELAGLAVERLVSEPVAAALAYAANRPVNQKLLVVRFGGGSFDVALLAQQGKTGLELLATGGDTLLGGVDIDRALLDVLLKRFEEEQGATFSDNPVIVQRFLDAAETAKIALSTKEVYNVGIPFITVTPAYSVDFDTTVTRPELEQLAAPFIERALQITRDVLAARKVKPNDIGELLLVGGQARMPLLQAKLKELTGREPARGVNPEEVAALGASLLAHRIASKQLDGLKLDLLPAPVGVGRPGGGMEVLFDRAAQLPQKFTHTVATERADQTTLDVFFFQGEQKRALDNEFIGGVHVEGLPGGSAGSVKVGLVLELTTDGVLNVSQRHADGRETPLAVGMAYNTAQLRESLGDTGAPPKRGGVWNAVRGLFRKRKK